MDRRAPQSCTTFKRDEICLAAWQAYTLTSSFVLFLIQVLFRAAFALLSLPSQDFVIQRHQGPPIHNDGSSLVDLSLNSYTVLIIEMQDESGPQPDLSVFLLESSLNQFSLLDSRCKTSNSKTLLYSHLYNLSQLKLVQRTVNSYFFFLGYGPGSPVSVAIYCLWCSCSL